MHMKQVMYMAYVVTKKTQDNTSQTMLLVWCWGHNRLEEACNYFADKHDFDSCCMLPFKNSSLTAKIGENKVHAKKGFTIHVLCLFY